MKVIIEKGANYEKAKADTQRMLAKMIVKAANNQKAS
jgi:hypothetical protein